MQNHDIHLMNQVTIDPLIAVDQNLMKTVVRNLLDNALKFTPKGGTITLAAIVRERLVHLTVSDTGSGMTAETLTLLQSMLRGAGEFQSETGTGLALTLCKIILEKHDGEIHIDSQLDQGTSVTISLPISTAYG